MPAYCPEGDPEFMPTPEHGRIARKDEIEQIILGRIDAPEGVDFTELAREYQALCGRVTKVRWNFWLPDSDRSTGWTNHGYVLQFVCAGEGATPAEAWESAKRGEIADLGLPEGFYLPDNVIAIREDAEQPIEVS